MNSWCSDCRSYNRCQPCMIRDQSNRQVMNKYRFGYRFGRTPDYQGSED